VTAHIDPPAPAEAALAVVTPALRERFVPGRLDHALVQLRHALRSARCGEPAERESLSGAGPRD
jgi:hypothetical protein